MVTDEKKSCQPEKTGVRVGPAMLQQRNANGAADTRRGCVPAARRELLIDDHLTFRGDVAGASLNLVLYFLAFPVHLLQLLAVLVHQLDLELAEFPVAYRVTGGVAQRVLVAQVVGDVGEDAAELPVEAWKKRAAT